MSLPKIAVGVVWAFAGSVLVLGLVSGCGGDDEASAATTSETTGTVGAGSESGSTGAADGAGGAPPSGSSTTAYPHLSGEYSADCDGYTARLRDCGVLGDGRFSCTEPENSVQECAYECLAIASCSILAQFQCTRTAAAPLELCLTKCNTFTCGSGESIDPLWQCDGEDDCEDGSDERDCYVCGSGEVFPESYECDFFDDCADGSDEADCEGFACGSGESIAASWRCDYEVDCADGSDEAGCDGFVCEATGESISPHWQCDGEEDCLDGSDEVDCARLYCR